MDIVVIIVLSLTICFVTGRDIGKFWQVSDFHYDANYSIFGDPDRECHKGGKESGSSLGQFGDYLCDAPWSLVTAAIQAMESLQPDVDFILWTGDSVPHINETEHDLSKNVITIGNVTDAILAAFPNTSIYPVLGNHDPYPQDQMPSNQSQDHGDNFYQDVIKYSGWYKLLGTPQEETFYRGGYYTSSVSGLRFICLNTNLYYQFDRLVKNISDPANQFIWLEKALNAARINKEKVYIVSHIAPGAFERVTNIVWFYPKFNDRYLKIVKEYSDIIMGQFYGHEHTDSFRVLYDDQQNPIGQMFLSPAVTPWKSPLPGVGSNNPSVRLYHYDRDTAEVLDIFQYYVNLTEANSVKTTNWILEYQMTKDLGINDLTPKSLAALAKSFSHVHKKDSFTKYLRFNSVSYATKYKCNETCHRTQICAIQEVEIEKYKICLASSHPHPHTTPSTSTTITPFLSTTDHTHHRHHPIPKYMYYVIIGLVSLVCLLFVIVAVLCVGRRNHMTPMRYNRLPSYTTGIN